MAKKKKNVRESHEDRVTCGWLKVNNSCLRVIHMSNMSFSTEKSFAKKLARIETSSICCQQSANLFANSYCKVHTCQLGFVNSCLLCEGALRQYIPAGIDLSMFSDVILVGEQIKLQ